MAFLPSMRASTSRVTLPAIPALSASRSRAFRASPTARKGEIGTTIQDADKALADMQKAAMQMRKSGRSVDISAMPTPVLERNVDPAFKLSWLFKKKGREYTWERVTRYRTTVKFLNDMINNELFPKQRGSRWPVSLIKSILCLRPTYKGTYLVKELEEVYQRFNEAQAAGDEASIRTLATGDALTLAQRVAKIKRNMSWKLVKHNTPPRLLSARIAPLDPEKKSELAQVVISFDTEQIAQKILQYITAEKGKDGTKERKLTTQALTTKGTNGSQTKQQRVVENCVFERHLPATKGWRLKETLAVINPQM